VNRLHDFAIRRPRLVLLVALALTLTVAPGMLRLHLRTDGHALIPPNAPAVRIDKQVRREFGVLDPLVILIRSRHADGIFDPGTLGLIAHLTHTMAGLPGLDSASVRSLATEPSDRFRPNSLLRRTLLEPLPRTRAEMDRLRTEIADIGLLSGTLISRDGRSAAILAGVTSGADRTSIVSRVRAVIASTDTTGHDVRVLGAPAAEALLGTHILEDLGISMHRRGWRAETFDPATEAAMGTIARLRQAIAHNLGLLPIAFIFMALVFLISFRSLAATWLPLSEAVACLMFVFGLMGWGGVPVYLTMAVLPVILVSMGLADEIHVFTSYRRRLAEHPDESRACAVRAALNETSLPVLATGWTTAIGFLAFALSPLAPVRAFGIFTAAGIVFCMVWTLTVIPALLVLLPLRALAGPRREMRATARPVRWVRLVERLGSQPIVTLTITAVALLLSPLAIRQVVVQDSWISGFAPSSAFYRSTQYFDQQFYGTHRLLLAIDTGHIDLKGALPAADLRDEMILFPDSLVADPAWLVGCSLAVTVRMRSPAPPGPPGVGLVPATRGPAYWSSVVENAARGGGRIAVTTPLYHGSARFLLMPAPSETLDFVLRSQRLALPAVVMALDSLEQFVRAQGRYAVGGVLGPPDYIASVEYMMSDRSPGSRGVPSDPDRVRWLWSALRQVLGSARVREIVDPSLERGLITVFLKNANYRDTAQLMAAVRDYERTHLTPQRIRLDFAGDVAVSQALIEAIVRSQVGSLLASLLGVLAVIAILFHSVSWGMFCMVPAGIAVAATFAMMGLTAMPLGVATSMFSSMVLGVGVDFAIHLVHRYRESIRGGVRHEAAVQDALAATGPGILINALAVTVGFGILMLSQVPANAQLGAITVVSLLGCLAATLLVIPALLRVATPGARAAKSAATPVAVS